MSDAPTPLVDHTGARVGNRAVQLTEQELVTALQASAQLAENRLKVIRTAELDAEKQQLTGVVNQVLSRHAFEALKALEFMYMVVPTQLGEIAKILSSHRFTYVPLAESLNQIARMRQAAANAAQQESEASDG